MFDLPGLFTRNSTSCWNARQGSSCFNLEPFNNAANVKKKEKKTSHKKRMGAVTESITACKLCSMVTARVSLSAECNYVLFRLPSISTNDFARYAAMPSRTRWAFFRFSVDRRFVFHMLVLPSKKWRARFSLLKLFIRQKHMV